MKAFVFEKNIVQNQENESITAVEVEDKTKFNFIVMSNPYNSNFLCIINSVKIKLKENNCFFIEPGENLYEDEYEKDKDSLNIMSFYKPDRECDNNMINLINLKNSFDLLCSYYAILIPGGKLSIKFKEPVEHVNIQVKWIKEQI